MGKGKGEGPEKIGIRGLDPDIWVRVRVQALKEGLSTGDLVNRILTEWLERVEPEHVATERAE